jgi:polysaccharide biosynthesis transport protein
MNLKSTLNDNMHVPMKANAEELDLQRYGRLLKRRWPIVAISCLTVTGLATFVALHQKPAYEVVAKIVIKSEPNSSLTGINVGLGDLKALGASQQKDPIMTQMETVKSVPIFKQALASVPLPPGQKLLTPEALLKAVKVKETAGADILQISYQSDNRQYGTALVNALVQEYIASNIRDNRAEAAAARQFISQQLPKSEAGVRQAELALRQFKERGNIVALGQETGQAVTRIGDLNTQVDQTQAQLTESRARLAKLRQQLGTNPQMAVDLGRLRKSSGVQEVVTKLQTAQSNLAIERTRYRENHPIVTNLRSQVESLNALLAQRVAEVSPNGPPVAVGQLQSDDLNQTLTASYLQTEVDVTALSQRLDQLSAQRAMRQNRAATLPGLEATQRELERQLKAAQLTYETLLTKLQEVQVVENQQVGNVRVVQPATAPDKPAPARRVLIMTAGLLAGLLSGIALALLWDLLDQSLPTLTLIREQLDEPLLGAIPVVDRSRRRWDTPQLLRRDAPQSIACQAYQMLQANLMFLSDDRGLKSLLVTSAIDGEGKSEVALNLAVERAQMGRRVLLVDLNLAQPMLDAVWDLPNVVGLSQVLMGTGQADAVLQAVMPNLDLLMTGGTRPDPVSLLESQRMAKVVRDYVGRYDLVIFDAPAVSRWVNVAMMGRLADGIVWVVRPGQLTITAANAAKAQLAPVRSKILGMVANGVNWRQEPDMVMDDRLPPGMTGVGSASRGATSLV